MGSIGVVGLGKLGAPLAAVYASAGFPVIGYDLNSEAVAAVNAGKAPVSETNLQFVMDNPENNLCATTDAKDLVTRADITFLIVPTPTVDGGGFSNEHILSALEALAPALKDKVNHHLLVICSTVMPGSMDREIVPTLEALTGKKVGGGQLGLCYNPEFIALGSVIHNMRNPDIVLIGESDENSGEILAGLHHRICENSPDIQRMNFVNAELTKLAINTFVTTKISYANMLAEICENLPDANVDIVTNAIGGDSRIGRKYLTGAIKYGGPCFPRDNQALSAVGETIGVECTLAAATDRINDRQTDRLMRFVSAIAQPQDQICIAGLTYKADTSETIESQGMALYERLVQAGYRVKAYDSGLSKVQCPDQVDLFQDMALAAEGCNMLIIITPWPDLGQHVASLHDITILDPWRHIDPTTLSPTARIVQMGVGASTPQTPNDVSR